MIRVLIIEDEIKAARELKFLVEQMHEDIVVCGILQSVEESLAWFNTNEMPNLIISDIQLSDGVSFDIFRSISVHAPVIFCTAYHEYALQAFEANGVDYMLKPVEKEKLRKSFDKLLQFKEYLTSQPPEYKVNLDKMLIQLNEKVYRNSVLVYAGNKIISVNTENIDLILSANNLVYLHTSNQKFELRETLESLMQELNPVDFYRANRQTIISRKAIVNVRHSDSRKLELTPTTARAQPVIISKEKASAFLKWMKSN